MINTIISIESLVLKALVYLFFDTILILLVIETLRKTQKLIYKELRSYSYSKYKAQKYYLLKFMVHYPKYLHPIFYNKYKEKLKRDLNSYKSKL